MNVSESSRPNWALHYLALILASFAASVLFIREPGFGDELGYWNLAFDLHEVGRHAWSIKSFHDLRWPIWGLNWLGIACFGPGLASFYCEPAFYMAAGSAVAFTLGRLTLRSVGAAWACGIALWFAPVLDAVVWRPMPDLSESFFGGCAVLGWWAMMQARDSRRATFFGALSGVAIGLAFSNRIAGVFIAPVLAVATLMLYPRRWKWLLVPALFSAVYVCIEGAVYYAVCGDALHALHANMGGRGAKDVEESTLWQLPFRYLGGFFKQNRLAPVYACTAAVGLWSAWRKRGEPGRVVVIWFVVVYLEYSCMIQSVHPLRPLFGSTFRYLAGFCIPMSVLAVIGIVELLETAARLSPAWGTRGQALARRPLVLGAAAVVALALYTKRPLFDLGYIRPYRRHLAALPDGTKIFTHHQMRDLAFLAAPNDARRMAFTAPPKILARQEELEKQAASCDELWYLRKHLWLTERKAVEHDLPKKQPTLASYIDTPERDWMLSDVLLQGDAPELAFYRKRPTGEPPPHVLAANAPEFAGLLPPPPVSWNAKTGKKRYEFKWTVPDTWRGKLVTFQCHAASPTVEPIQLKLRFIKGHKHVLECDFKPIFYTAGGKEFVAIPFPQEGPECEVTLIFTKAKEVVLNDFRAIYDDAR